MTHICHGMTADGNPCQSTVLIDAHIVPRGFAREIMSGALNLKQISLARVATTQHGVYDPNILCATCDGTLGVFDAYGIQVVRRLPAEHIAERNTFLLERVDGPMFAKFVLAVIWRASISTRPEFKKVALGPYSQEAREVLFGARSLEAMPSYQLMVALLQSKEGGNPQLATRFYTSPTTGRVDGMNGCQFALGGLKFMAKMDKRPFRRELLPAMVTVNDHLFGSILDLESTIEYRTLMSMAGAELGRKAGRKR